MEKTSEVVNQDFLTEIEKETRGGARRAKVPERAQAGAKEKKNPGVMEKKKKKSYP